MFLGLADFVSSGWVNTELFAVGQQCRPGVCQASIVVVLGTQCSLLVCGDAQAGSIVDKIRGELGVEVADLSV